jgi:16S rRNA (uracil1498-N3)-methyltransferase
MHRFFIDRIQGEIVSLTDTEQLHHLKDVLRLKVNDGVSIFDGEGNDYAGVITGIDKRQVEIKVKQVRSANKTSLKLTVACAIPKGSRMDEVIDYLTQLGVERIIPMRTERTVVKLDSAKTEARLKRWQKIAQSAAQQSQRSRIPVIESVARFEDVILNSQDYDLKLIPNLSGERKPIREVVAETRPKDVLVLVGPEGDFTAEEVGLALSQGFIAVSLGDTVLRVATAAIAVASYIKFTVDS